MSLQVELFASYIDINEVREFIGEHREEYEKFLIEQENKSVRTENNVKKNRSSKKIGKNK